MQRDHQDAYDPGSHYRVAVIPFKEVLGERARLTLWLLMAAAAFVLIISAANVANLTLMRGVQREHELVVRAALGAGVARLRRLLLVENLALTLVGAGFGVLLAIGGVRLLTSLAERYSPRASEIRLDGVVLGYTSALAVALALLLSFLASLPKEGTFASWIAAGMRRISGSLKKQRLQRGLVVVQIAVSVMEDASRLRVSVTTTPLLARTLHAGTLLEARIEDLPAIAVVEGVVPVQGGGLYTVNAIVRDADGRFASGGAATLLLPSGSRLALLVPRAAIARQGDLTGIRVWQGEGAELRWVRLGAERGDLVDVLSGLKGDEMIALPHITEGN